jgi:hypothetical protein
MEPDNPRPTRKAGVNDLVGGLAIAAVGGIATLVSHEMAQHAVEQGGTGVWTVFRGVILIGLVLAGRGVWRLLTQPADQTPEQVPDEPEHR